MTVTTGAGLVGGTVAVVDVALVVVEATAVDTATFDVVGDTLHRVDVVVAGTASTFDGWPCPPLPAWARPTTTPIVAVSTAAAPMTAVRLERQDQARGDGSVVDR